VFCHPVLQFEVPVVLARLLPEHTPNLVISVILCGKIVLILCKFGFCFSFWEYMNLTNGSYIYLKIENTNVFAVCTVLCRKNSVGTCLCSYVEVNGAIVVVWISPCSFLRTYSLYVFFISYFCANLPNFLSVISNSVMWN
jgi:hypothetical protein